ncbi:MAG: hypothetical protein DWB44_16670 [Chloroflexi bacterium]|nr:hypothetical protein [Chloroflexota bacterium]RIK18845.1 MAG: hypothetical protein DCC53_15380 [Chloroflexota bacterium]
MPVVRGEPKLYFQTLVALNLLRIATREIGAAPELAAVEQHVLTALTGDSEGVPTARIRSLCASIRSGAFDDPEQFDMALQYLGHWVNAQLAVNNPALAQRMQVEHDSGQVAL